MQRIQEHSWIGFYFSSYDAISESFTQSVLKMKTSFFLFREMIRLIYLLKWAKQKNHQLLPVILLTLYKAVMYFQKDAFQILYLIIMSLVGVHMPDSPLSQPASLELCLLTEAQFSDLSSTKPIWQGVLWFCSQ